MRQRVEPRNYGRVQTAPSSPSPHPLEQTRDSSLLICTVLTRQSVSVPGVTTTVRPRFSVRSRPSQPDLNEPCYCPTTFYRNEERLDRTLPTRTARSPTRSPLPSVGNDLRESSPSSFVSPTPLFQPPVRHDRTRTGRVPRLTHGYTIRRETVFISVECKHLTRIRKFRESGCTTLVERNEERGTPPTLTYHTFFVNPETPPG